MRPFGAAEVREMCFVRCCFVASDVYSAVYILRVYCLYITFLFGFLLLGAVKLSSFIFPIVLITEDLFPMELSYPPFLQVLKL